MRTLVVLTTLIAAGLSLHIATTRGAPRGGTRPAPLVLDAGDSFRVAGTPIGCQVVARGGAKTVDCRVAGLPAGTYGTLMTSTRILVVRFRSAHLAKEVFAATQRGSAGVCR